MVYIKLGHSFIQKSKMNIFRAETTILFIITRGVREACFKCETGLPYRIRPFCFQTLFPHMLSTPLQTHTILECADTQLAFNFEF